MVLGYKPAKLRVREALPVCPSRLTHVAAESSNRPNAGDADHSPARPHWTPSSLFGFESEGVQRNFFLLFAFFPVIERIFFFFARF